MTTTTGPRADTLLDPHAVAAELGIHARTVRRLVERGELGHVRIGRLVKVRRSQLDAYLAAVTVDVPR